MILPFSSKDDLTPGSGRGFFAGCFRPRTVVKARWRDRPAGEVVAMAGGVFVQADGLELPDGDSLKRPALRLVDAGGKLLP